jgi:hypothetical protein
VSWPPLPVSQQRSKSPLFRVSPLRTTEAVEETLVSTALLLLPRLRRDARAVQADAAQLATFPSRPADSEYSGQCAPAATPARKVTFHGSAPVSDPDGHRWRGRRNEFRTQNLHFGENGEQVPKNYHQARKQRELTRKARQQEKQQRRSARPGITGQNAPATAPVAEPAAPRDPPSGRQP